jgi:predicted Rossmann fold nucleotide-binding protein DprA/Smf involved in DNA uptake
LLNAADSRYPARLRERLGTRAPDALTALGNLDLLALPKTALFCSARCPGDAILRAYDQAAKWRDEGRCVISGFHSPVEKECLRILLRGQQPIIICPARALPKRLPAEWKKPLADGRLLILSCFTATHCRATAKFAARRNELVAALAEEVWFAHITPGGQMQQLANKVAAWS